MKALRQAGSAALGVAVCLLAGMPLAAQTAHFSGAIEALGSGFSLPQGVALDRSGNVFVADWVNGKVYEIVAASGYTTVNTLGGGFSGPSAVAVDGSGDVFVADESHNLVKEIPASCIAGANDSTCVLTLGSGFDYPDGVAVDGSGNVFVGDALHYAVKEIPASCIAGANNSTCMLTLGSGFSGPAGVAVDGSGNVFVADGIEVKEIPASCIAGANNSTCVLTLGSGFAYPQGVAVDGSGNVFVGDTNNSEVKEIPASCIAGANNSTCVLTLGGGFFQPWGVAVDGSGNVFVADENNAAVKEIMTPSGNFGAVNVNSTSAAPLSFYFTFDTGGSIGAPAVLKWGAPNKDFTDAGTGTCTTNGNTHIYAIGDTCTVNVTFKPRHPGWRYGAVELLDGSGNLLATGRARGTGVGPQVVFANTTTGAYLPSATNSLGSGFAGPTGVAAGPGGNVFVADSGNNKVKEILAAGGYTTVNIVGNGFSLPRGVALDGSGNVFVADADNNAVKEIVAGTGGAAAGTVNSSSTVNTLGSGISGPEGVAVDGNGNVFVAAYGNNAVKEIPASCIAGANNYTCVLTLGSGFNQPAGVAVDGSGNVFVADASNNAVKEIPASCIAGANNSTCVLTLGSGFTYPSSVAVDASGNVFVADSYNNAVKEILAAGGYTTVNTLSTAFSFPFGVAVDGKGNVYVGGRGNSTVWKLDYLDPPSLGFASTSVGTTSSDSPQSVTVSNNGNVNLAFSALSYPADFPEASGVGTDCSASSIVAEGTSCTLSIDFTPQQWSSTPLSESVGLTTDSKNLITPQSVGVSGAVTAVPASLTSPNVGSMLTGPSVTFTWTTETGATGYKFWIGTTAGGSDIYNSGPVTATSATPAILPTNGETVYVRLWTNYNGTYVYSDSTYTAATQAAITSPAGGTVLAGPAVTFTWTAATGATGYKLWIGASAGGNNIYNSGPVTATSATPATLPTNGETVHVRLWTNYNGSYVYTDYTYTAATQAAITSPAGSTVLAGPAVKFTWTAATGATGYKLWIGASAGGNSIYNSGPITATSATPNALPTNGGTVYVRLWTNYNGTYVSSDYTYTAATQAAITSPAGGTVLAGPAVKFTWTAAAGATGYKFWVGTAAGANNIYNSGPTTATSATPTALPTNGEAVYVRLWTNYNGTYVSSDYTFTAATQGAITSPAGGTVLAGPAVKFTWTAAAGATGYKFWVGATAGGNSIYNSGPITATSATPTALPTNGGTVYVRLWTNYNGTYVSSDYTYTAATQAAITSPAGGTVLAGPAVKFTWTAAAGATGYKFWVGTAAGANNIYNSGPITATSATPATLPTNGETVYVRLWTNYNGTYVSSDYTYTAYTVP